MNKKRRPLIPVVAIFVLALLLVISLSFLFQWRDGANLPGNIMVLVILNLNIILLLVLILLVFRNLVKLYFDVWNTMLCGFPEDWIGHLKDYICCFHMKDFDKNINTLYGWKNIFQGHINWHEVAKAIKDMGYNGYLVGEPSLTPFAYQPEELVKTTSSALSRVIEMIENA